MALPTVQKTWQYNLDINVAGAGDYRARFLVIKAAMKGFALNPWTVKGSSNGLTAGMDGVDRWAANGDLMATTTPGAARGWLVMRNAAGAEILFHLWGIGSANTGNWITFFSGGGMFGAASGGTNGSITARPTAPDETPAYDENNVWWLMGGGSTSTKVNLLHSTDGRETRMIMIFGGIGYEFTWLMGEFDKSTLPNKNYWILDTFRGSGLFSTPNIDRDDRGVMFTTPAGGRRGWMSTEARSNSNWVAQQTVGNEINGGRWPMAPVYLQSAVSPWVDCGRLKDVWLGSINVPFGSAYPLTPSPTRQFAQYGRWIHPWNGSVPVTS